MCLPACVRTCKSPLDTMLKRGGGGDDGSGGDGGGGSRDDGGGGGGGGVEVMVRYATRKEINALSNNAA